MLVKKLDEKILIKLSKLLIALLTKLIGSCPQAGEQAFCSGARDTLANRDQIMTDSKASVSKFKFLR